MESTTVSGLNITKKFTPGEDEEGLPIIYCILMVVLIIAIICSFIKCFKAAVSELCGCLRDSLRSCTTDLCTFCNSLCESLTGHAVCRKYQEEDSSIHRPERDHQENNDQLSHEFTGLCHDQGPEGIDHQDNTSQFHLTDSLSDLNSSDASTDENTAMNQSAEPSAPQLDTYIRPRSYVHPAIGYPTPPENPSDPPPSYESVTAGQPAALPTLTPPSYHDVMQNRN